MTQDTVLIAAACTAVLLSLLLLVTTVVLKRRCSATRKELQASHKLLAEQEQRLAKLQEVAENFNNFRKDLQTAELTTRIQQPRLELNQKKAAGSIPERYRYVQGLIARGIPQNDIASILSISQHETDQLVSLATIAGS